MKALHLNLASRPYRDYRPVYAVVVVASLLIAFLMLNNVDTYYRYVRETRTTRTEIARIASQTRQERGRAQVANNQIRTIDLVALGKQSRYINSQLAERAFSWSELLDRLETVLPTDVRVTAIAPSFSEDGIVRLTLACEGKSSQAMLATLSRMQQSQSFARPFPSVESSTPEGYTFGITVDFKPSIPRTVAR